MAPPPTPRKKGKPNQSEYKAIAAQFAAARRAQQINDPKTTQQRSSAVDRRREARDAERKATYELRWLWTIAFWMWLLAIHFAGILYFTSGFLLTRLVLDKQATCAESPLEGAVAPVGDSCWHPKTFDRAVVVLIDALRYDFTVPANDSAEFHNAFPFLYETAVAQPQNAFLRPFIADPPTTTLQRLKGLTTGTLPTFIDMGSNFAGTAIEEDNLLAQLRANGKKIVHLGDDTWAALFPGYFEPNISHAYDSLNVWDLHTVDNGVLDHIFPLVEAAKTTKASKGEKDWDLLIGHCLGVDHAGHRYGPSHPAMTSKLQQMNDFIRRLAATIDDDTLLVVMGDHGMDSKGDHGGESDDEIEAALWMYAKRPLFGRTSPAFVTPPATAKQRPTNQIDLVPTLALLLGIPIPYNNLGWPIEEAFVGASGDNWANLATVGEITAAGIHRYQASYFEARGIEPAGSPTVPEPVVKTLTGKRMSASTRKQAMADAYAALAKYQADNLRICKDLWARFDMHSMVLGIAIMALGVVALVLYASRSQQDSDDDDIALVEDPTLDHAEMMLELQGELAEPTQGNGSNGSSESKPAADKDSAQDEASLKQLQHLHRSLVLAGVAGAVPTFLAGLVYSLLFSGGEQPWFVGVGYAAATSTVAVSASLLGVGQRRLLSLLPSSVWGWLAVVFTVAQSVGFASNSYTIWEDGILLFFLATFGAVAALAALRLISSPADRALAVYHAILFVLLGRLASLSRLCREEQMPYCTSTYYASANSSTSAPWQLAVPFLVFLILPGIVRAYYVPTRAYEGLAPLWIGYALRCGLLMAAVYWTLDAADNGNWFEGADFLAKGALKTSSVYLAQTTLGLALVAGTVAFVWASPCVRMTASAAPGTNHAQVIVLGYANAHGARYLLLPINILMAVVLLSKPMGGGALALMLWQVMSLVELLDLLKSGSASGSGSGDDEPEAVSAEEAATTGAGTGTTTTVSASSISVIGPVVLAMLANFHYFTTGHQAALSSIQWDSAFIPLFTIRYPWSPLVVVANTFPGHVLAAAAVPLLVLWKTGPRRRGGLLSPTSRALAGFAAYFAVEAVATMTWAAHLRRHLMLYRVFNPRFMLAAATLLLVDVAGIVIALMGLRANTLSVSEVFGWVDDY